MADITNLSNFLGDVADAIRSKKGSEESIPAKKFDEEILSIETGIDTSDADATEENIEKGKTAYVNGEKITGTLSTQGTVDVMVSADNIIVGKERGWDCVSTTYTNTEKKIHNAGWKAQQHMKFEDLAPALGVTADKIVAGNTILGVAGTAEGGGGTVEGTKIFANVEEMNADTTAKEGDLATVCGKNTFPVYKTTTFNNIVVRETFTISRPISARIQGGFRAVDSSFQSSDSMSIMASGTSISISGKINSTQYSIRYTSTDGLTFNLSSNNYPGGHGANLIFFEQYYDWDELISEIILTEMNDYKGLYEYNETDGYRPIISQISLKNSYDIKPGLKAIGADGEIIGTDDFYEHIELSTLISKHTDTKKYEKGIFVESTHTDLTGIIDKDITTVDDFKNLVIFKKGMPYYYEEFDDTNGTANITFVFSTYHVRICGDVPNLCAYMYIYDLNNNLVHEETVSIPKLDKATRGRIQRFCIGETKSNIIFGLYCAQTTKVWTFDKLTHKLTTVYTQDDKTEINDCSDVASFNDDWFFAIGYYSSSGTGFRIFDKDGISQHYNTGTEYFGSYFNKAIDDTYYYLSYKYSTSYKDYALHVIRKSDKVYMGKIDTSGSSTYKANQLVVAKGLDGKVYLLKGTDATDNKYNYNLYQMNGTTMTLIKENVFMNVSAPSRDILYCIWDGTNCALLQDNGNIWNGDFVSNITNKAAGMFIEYFKGEGPYCLGELKDGMLIRYTFDLDKVFGDTDKVSIIKSGIPDEFLVLFNDFQIYKETITPEEYDEINAIAEDVLGGVE